MTASTSGWIGADAVSAPAVLLVLAVVVDAPFTAPAVLAEAAAVLLPFLLAVVICFTTLAVPGVGCEVQYHLPLASVQD